MDHEPIVCLLSHKCSAELCGKQIGSLSRRLAESLAHYRITLLVDPFRYADDFNVRMKSVEFDALLLLISPASLRSKPVQMELRTARRRGVPIFTALLEGEIPGNFDHRRSWDLKDMNDEQFADQVGLLADSMWMRVRAYREIQLLNETNPPDITEGAARNLATFDDRSVVSELAGELAKRYRRISDPTTCFFIALALGNACTPEAAKLLRALPEKDHPLPGEGIQQALEMIAYEC
jgi:hypothetical protein